MQKNFPKVLFLSLKKIKVKILDDIKFSTFRKYFITNILLFFSLLILWEYGREKAHTFS